MADEEEEVLQLVSKELKIFGNRNKPKLRLIEDLKLSCDLCKTSEATKKIQDILKIEFNPVLSEQDLFNARMEQIFKTTKLEKPSPQFYKKLNGMYDKTMKDVIPGRAGLKFDLKTKDVKKKKVPMLHLKVPF